MYFALMCICCNFDYNVQFAYNYVQVLPQSHMICHQSRYQMVYWCSAGLLHGLLMRYSWTTQSLWLTPTPVWWGTTPPPTPASLSPDQMLREMENVTSMCGVWLLSTQLVSVYLLTTPLQCHLSKVYVYVHVSVCMQGPFIIMCIYVHHVCSNCTHVLYVW